MKSIVFSIFAAWVLLFSTAASPETLEAFKPSDYKVFIDQTTGFAFVKTPYGWKFIRKIEPHLSAEQAVALQRTSNEKR